MGRRLKYRNRDEVVARMRQPGAPSIGVLSEETGVPKATLYAWLRLSGGRSVGGAAEGNHMGKSKGRKRSPTQKLKLLAKSIELEGEALTRFCRDNQFLLSEVMPPGSGQNVRLTSPEMGRRNGQNETEIP